jgi:hypothetical protein
MIAEDRNRDLTLHVSDLITEQVSAVHLTPTPPAGQARAR